MNPPFRMPSSRPGRLLVMALGAASVVGLAALPATTSAHASEDPHIAQAATLAKNLLAEWGGSIDGESWVRADLVAASESRTITNSDSCGNAVRLDVRMLDALTKAAARFDVNLSTIVTHHGCDSGLHPRGMAFDVQRLTDPRTGAFTELDGSNPALDQSFINYLVNVVPDYAELGQTDCAGRLNTVVRATIHYNLNDACNHQHVGVQSSSPYLAVDTTVSSRRQVVVSADGDSVYFIGADNKVATDYHNTNGWNGPAAIGGTARPDSPLAVKADGSAVYFIDTNNRVVNTYHDATGWHGPAAIGGTARAGSDIAVSDDGTTVFFVDTAGRVVNDYYVGGWNGPGATGGTARTDSPLAAKADGSAVYFIDTNNRVVNDYHTTNGWNGPGGTGGTAIAGSDIAISDDGTTVFFVDTASRIVNDYYVGGWHGPAATGGTARATTGLAAKADGTAVYFANTNGQLVNDYHTTNGWTGPGATGGTAHPHSTIAVRDDGTAVYFADTNSRIVNDYYVNGWNGPATVGGGVTP